MRQLTSDIPSEIARWQDLGVATLPGPVREKGPRLPDWRGLPIADCWRRSGLAAAQGPTNLLIRSGATTNPDRFLTGIDLDGKYPCGHDHDDHADHGCDDDGCDCEVYRGHDPDEALQELQEILPTGVAVIQTARGYHIDFFTNAATPAGLLDAYSAEIYGDGQALHVPCSIHPTGWHYRWIVEPDGDLPVVDLAAVGLHPTPKRSGLKAARPPCVRGPASRARQQIFADLMAQAGVHAQGRTEEYHLCPWHPDAATDSLHVDWERAIFHCFGCAVGGGLHQLRAQIATAPPSCDPERDEIDPGSQLGGGWAPRRAEAARFAEALDTLGEGARALKVRACASTFEWDAAKATEWEAFACPNGDSAPLRPVRPHSCDEALCAVCMPQRLAQDFNKRAMAVTPAGGLTIATLEATTLSAGFEDRPYLTRVRAAFREYRRSHGLQGGFYGLTLARDATGWRGTLWIAIGDGDAERLADSRAFTMAIRARGAAPADALQTWQVAYLGEATAWRDADQLQALRLLTHGRRKFQGFGDYYATQPEALPAGDEETEARPSLHRISGRSGKAARTAPCCPRCGATLYGVGRFDADRMEMLAAPDGLIEWR